MKQDLKSEKGKRQNVKIPNQKKQKLKQKQNLNESDSDDTFQIEDDDEDDEDDSEWVSDLINGEADENGMITVNAAGLAKILEKTNPEASENLKKVLETIEKRTPNFITLLNEDLDHEHRVKLIELYEALKEYEAAGAEGHPCKLEYLSLRDHINELTKKYKRKKITNNKLSKKIQKTIEKTKKDLEESKEDEDALENKILNLDTSFENRVAIYNKYKKYDRLSSSDEEKAKLQTWLQWATSIPHNKIKLEKPGKKIPEILADLAISLDKELFGMKGVKEQILTFVNSRLTNPRVKGCSLALIGPPGTGKNHNCKTSIF